MVAHDGWTVFYRRQKTRGKYHLIKTQLEESFIKIKASAQQQPQIKTKPTKNT